MNRQTLFPTEVTAHRMGNEPFVTIIAKGYEDGITKIRIEASMATIYPPIYMVTGEPYAAIGMFPYTAQRTVPYSTDLDYISFQMSNGTQKVNIVDVLKQQKNLPSALEKVTNKQVVGYAYNSADINVAIQNAVTKLQQAFPSSVNAKLIESGFVAAGSPVGIAYFYVVMEQQ